MHLRVRTDAAAVGAALRRKVAELDKNLPLFDVHTVEVERSLARERLVGTVTGLFGALALALAAVGLYGLMAYGVSQRTREFGIRMAVGAKSGSIARLVLREAAWLTAAGVVLGMSAAWALGRVVRSMLFGVEPTDPASALTAVAVLVAAVLLAAWIPARRAARLDPTRALRCP